MWFVYYLIIDNNYFYFVIDSSATRRSICHLGVTCESSASGRSFVPARRHWPPWLSLHVISRDCVQRSLKKISPALILVSIVVKVGQSLSSLFVQGVILFRFYDRLSCNMIVLMFRLLHNILVWNWICWWSFFDCLTSAGCFASYYSTC